MCSYELSSADENRTAMSAVPWYLSSQADITRPPTLELEARQQLQVSSEISLLDMFLIITYILDFKH